MLGDLSRSYARQKGGSDGFALWLVQRRKSICSSDLLRPPGLPWHKALEYTSRLLDSLVELRLALPSCSFVLPPRQLGREILQQPSQPSIWHAGKLRER